MTQLRMVLSGFILALGAVLAHAGPNTITLPADTSTLRPSTLPGYSIAQQKCTICHSADYVNFQAPGLSLAQWTAEMGKMQHAYGAPIDDNEVKLLGAYLAVTYGSANASDPEVLALTAAAQKAATGAPSATADVLTVLDANACTGCHAIDQKVVGPSFKDVAAKYRGDAGAQARLVKSIREGGSGRWGEIAMPPMPNLSDAQLDLLAAYVLSQ